MHVYIFKSCGKAKLLEDLLAPGKEKKAKQTKSKKYICMQQGIDVCLCTYVCNKVLVYMSCARKFFKFIFVAGNMP